ncbi:8-oxoguanine deaminase [Kaistia dalseonensis]|uniref:8-oxoguanine deaminase n=1 Tax=Kaistia dalseonensis TaxID=410840 RepID=A0ABU0H6H5_9HYPH|nr:8-oxoguanine deaminase [Kaistia dalseonensis]MCX5494535.1 8-oxoguanine deaminase [Kaistia dalseonensis]MDQ0437114.1 8-oxoguanine deaminase [Kaistia dalseonensis]
MQNAQGSAPERLWVKTPLAVMAEGAEGGIVVEDGRIAELVPGGAEPAHPVHAIFDASRHVVTPGLVNAHHHFYSNLTRTHPKGINKSLMPWLEGLYPLWAAKLNPENFRLACRMALTELLLSGCTTAADHHAMFAVGLEDAMDIQAEEAEKLGMRLTLVRGSRDLSVKDGMLAPENVVQSIDTILTDSERVIRRYNDRSEGSMVQVALAPDSMFTVSETLMRETAALAARLDCRLHTHLSERAAEVPASFELYGCGPIDRMEELGWINDRLWLAHAIHLDDAEIAKLGRHGVGVCHCPTSSMMLGAGRCRTNELEAAGCAIGLGADASAANDCSNAMGEVRQAMLLNRLTYDPADVSHLDALRWGTEGSARCLGRTDIGTIAVGKQADLAFYTVDELRFSGAGDPLAALVYCAAQSADRVMIRGGWQVEDGAPKGVDVGELIFEHTKASRAFLQAL